MVKDPRKCTDKNQIHPIVNSCEFRTGKIIYPINACGNFDIKPMVPYNDNSQIKLKITFRILSPYPVFLTVCYLE